MDIKELYQELIIDHGTHPRNCCPLDNASHNAEGFNPLCGDKVHVHMLIENDILKDITFEGIGCAISIASASIMTELLKGKTIEEAMESFNQFTDLLTLNNTSDNKNKSSLGKLEALAGVKTFPSRVKCATLAWHALKSAITQGEAYENF